MHRLFRRDKGPKNDSSDIGLSASASRSKVFPVGLKQLHKPESAIVDIIFVHGLTGDREKTWTSDGAKAPWPQDLLPLKLTQARILTFGYDASVVNWRSIVSKNRIGNHSRNLLAAVATYREDDETNDRPIIFVAHSLGGLVCEDALLASKNSADRHLQNILECTSGILFLGTPHSGSGFARWAELLGKSIGFIKQTNAKILEVLQSDSEVLARIQTEFHTMIRARTNQGQQPIAITCFFEELPLPGVGEVVPMNSAILPAYISIGIHSNHMGMTKFESEHDQGFLSVTGELRRWMKELKPLHGPTKPEASFLIPFDRDNHFIGREDVIDKIDRKLKTERRVALFGEGGIGKSQIAIEYCYRYRKKNPRGSIFWVYSSTAERFGQAYKDIARRLDLPGWNDPGVNTLQIVSDWLADGAREKWLMVLDNADDEHVFFNLPKRESSEGDRRNQRNGPLLAYVPQTPRGSILVTSRNRKVAFSLTNRAECIFDVPPMDMEAAIVLLHKKLPDDPSSDQDKADLVTILEHIPLAITQAAAYISVRNTRMTISKYLMYFQQNETVLMEDMKDLRRDPGVSNSVIITWQLSFDQIKKTHPRAAELLSIMSMLDRQGIPEFLFSNGDDNSEFEDAIAALNNFSLVTIETGGESFGIHRLVQLATRKWLELHDETEKWEHEAITLLSKSFPFGAFENWKKCRALLPHADAVLEYQNLDEYHSLQQAGLFYKTAVYSKNQGYYEVASEKSQSALNIYRKFLSEESKEILISLQFHAVMRAHQGEFDEAEKLLRKTLNTMRKVLGENSVDALSCQHELARLFFNQYKFDEAEKMHLAVLNMRQKTLGPKHPDTLSSMSNLANSMTCQGKSNEAERLHRASLNMKQKVLGLKDPATLTSMNNLANSLFYQKKYNEAEKLNRETLNMGQTILGSKHPDTLRSMQNMARALAKQRKYDEAENIIRRTLNLRETVLGKTHPDTLNSMNNLGWMLGNQGKHDKAENIIRQTLKLRETVLGKTHPDTLNSMDVLGWMLGNQGKHDEAENIFRRTLKLRETVLGETHLDTLNRMDYLGWVLGSKRKYDEAENIFRRTLKLRETVLGETHIETLRTMHNLGLMLGNQEKHDEAENIFRRTLKLRETVLGKTHPDTLYSMNSLRIALQNQGKLDEAEEISQRYQERKAGKERASKDADEDGQTDEVVEDGATSTNSGVLPRDEEQEEVDYADLLKQCSNMEMTESHTE